MTLIFFHKKGVVEQNRSGAPKKQSDFIAKLKKKHKRAKLPNTITIDSIYEKKFLSLSSVIEAVILSFQGIMDSHTARRIWPPMCLCLRGQMKLLQAGPERPNVGRFFYKCPDDIVHKNSFIWCDVFHQWDPPMLVLNFF
ncbi:hypothetical protein ACS0TY_009227 [Phlomoides rotata]